MRRGDAAKMRLIAEEAAELVRHYKGAYSGEHGDGLCRGEWVQWQFGPQISQAFAQIKNYLDPLNLLSPQRIVNPPKMDDMRLMRFPPKYRVIPLKTALDWSAWNVQNDPVTELTGAPGTGGRYRPGLCQGRGDVQQQRPLQKIRRRHDVPQLPRHARRKAPDTRARQHAATGPVRAVEC